MFSWRGGNPRSPVRVIEQPRIGHQLGTITVRRTYGVDSGFAQHSSKERVMDSLAAGFRGGTRTGTTVTCPTFYPVKLSCLPFWCRFSREKRNQSQVCDLHWQQATRPRTQTSFPWERSAKGFGGLRGDESLVPEGAPFLQALEKSRPCRSRGGAAEFWHPLGHREGPFLVLVTGFIGEFASAFQVPKERSSD